MVHANFYNDTSIKPYAIFYDSNRNEMVISIRGTLSLEDCITDANAQPLEFGDLAAKWGFNGAGRWAHEGMLRAAIKTLEDIEEKNIFKLVDILSTKSVNGPNYSIVVVGHSLGAAIASLMTIFLRSRYPSVKCFAFGVPGCVMDLQTAKELEGCVTSVILGSDLVPRASFHSIIRLKLRTLDAISRAKANKMTIFKSSFRHTPISELVYKVGAEPDCEFNRNMNRFKGIQEARLQSHLRLVMHIPGDIIYLEKFSRPTNSCLGSGRYFKPVYGKGRAAFADIRIDPAMAWDHLPDRYIDELKRLTQEAL